MVIAEERRTKAQQDACSDGRPAAAQKPALLRESAASCSSRARLLPRREMIGAAKARPSAKLWYPPMYTSS
eukprot:scaffold63029_cov72-Phaeocystis_antarctica.AAC.1